MTLKIYHVAMTRSIRPIWLLEELGQPYEAQVVPRDQLQEFQSSEQYLKINPMGKFPAMIDGEVTMIESIAIMEYILEKYPNNNLVPKPGPTDHAAYLQFLHFGESGMGPYVTMLLGHTVLLPEKARISGIAKWAKTETDKCLGLIDKALEGREYLCEYGFSAADISVTYMLYLLKLMKQFEDAPDNVKAYWKRVTARPAWQKASKLGM
ncbi:MAG: glutathione S-transferase family protein [bacterium]